jgi:glutamate racemase
LPLLFCFTFASSGTHKIRFQEKSTAMLGAAVTCGFGSGQMDQPRLAGVERSVMAAPTILIFDSGLGGLTVHREIAAARPDAHLIYAADDAAFPYGPIEASKLVSRVTAVIGALIESYKPHLAVIACNTASTIALPELRARFLLPFVGTVPAIKPACAASASKRVAVLGTEATVNREYTRALIKQFANGVDVTLVGSARLATFAEAELRGKPVKDDDIAGEIAACFIDTDGRRTDTVVLACTHYPLLRHRFERSQPWPVTYLDPAPAIARRVNQLLGPAQAADRIARKAQMVTTSGQHPSPELKKALFSFGIKEFGTISV